MIDLMLEALRHKRRDTLLRAIFLRLNADSSSASIDRVDLANLADANSLDGGAARLGMIQRHLDAELGRSDGKVSASWLA
mgnify:CR=1 FL=1